MHGSFDMALSGRIGWTRVIRCGTLNLHLDKIVFDKLGNARDGQDWVCGLLPACPSPESAFGCPRCSPFPL